ncbi:MAG: helix-turn-helix domain-containing protein, partial [Actinomycetota bacterium]|nr:helix-turn-helix domain-containing protein [Actinomycetota bacterium]
MPVGDDHSVKAAKALALPTRSAILGHLLRSGSLTAKEVADEFSLHPNVARAHLDLLVEAGFLATGIRRKGKGRPSKVYFTWEGEMGSLEDWEVSPPAPEEAATVGEADAGEVLPTVVEVPAPTAAPNP